LKQTPHEEG